MSEALFRFVEQAVSLAQKRCAASPTAVVSDPTGNGFVGWKYLTLHFLRIHMEASYTEIVEWVSEMDRSRSLAVVLHGVPGTLDAVAVLRAGADSDLEPTAPPISSGPRCRRAWGAGCHILRPQGGIQSLQALLESPHTHAENDGTGRCGVVYRPRSTLSGILSHDTQVGRRVTLRNTGKLDTLVGDKGYDDHSLRDALRLEV